MTRAAADLVYAGFWIRVWASIIDTVLLLIVLLPLASFIPGAVRYQSSSQLFTASGQINYNAFGAGMGMSLPGPVHILLFWVLPAVVVVLFWVARLATPGKMAIGAQIVDARTGTKPTSGQYVLRYIGYFVSTVPLCLGLIWVGIDRRKQGWHDKLARTVVVRHRQAVLATARFDDAPTGSSDAARGWKT